MLRTEKAVPAAVYLLADNLDTALAAGEDLLKSSLVWQSDSAHSPEALVLDRAEERSAVEATRALEMVLVARIMASRESAAELGRSDAQLKPIAKLYAAGTALLADAIDELGDGIKSQFHSGDDLTAYLRSRGFIADDAAAPTDPQVFSVTEEFRIFGRVPLGALLDLAATVLDMLETHYELYAGDDDFGASANGAANDGDASIEASV